MMIENERENAILILQQGNAPSRKWTLDREEYVIGRLPECDIVLPDRLVSRHHARLFQKNGSFWIEDMGSKNGTYVNGEPVVSPRQLKDGDEIQIALRFKLAFVGAEETAPLEMELEHKLWIDTRSHDVYLGNTRLDPPLSYAQYRLLEVLMEAEGRVVSRDEIISTVWPGEESGVSDQAVDALVRRLRERLAELSPHKQYVITVRGHGFRLEND
jgi:DNA-binding response OmpR family regulator